MKKIYLFLLLTAAGCSKFDEINTNPDKPVTVTSPMLATRLILDITRGDLGQTKSFMQHALLGKYISWSENQEANQYNKFGRISYSNLLVLNNVEKMISFAPDEKSRNTYKALGNFISAWKFYHLTMQVGDIPYKDALKGEAGVIQPAYNTQKEVLLGILASLDEADQLFANGSDFSGDPVYNGKVAKWRKMVNSFELRVLLSLYKKTGDADLQVMKRFQQIVNNRPLFSGNEDNFQLTYSDVAGQKYPFYKENNQFIIYNMVSDVLINRLKALQDRRLFYYAAPDPILVKGGAAANTYAAYKGVDPAATGDQVGAVASSKDYSPLNARYTELPAGEPVYLMGYAQLQFILAEAAMRGWINSSAEQYYNNGITAGMKFTADFTPDNAAYHHGMPITDTYIRDYIASAAVKFAATPREQLEQIITQEYLTTFMQAPYNAYFEYRRTGYPAFPINPASNQNIPADKMPVRWLYPQRELDYNGDNVTRATTAQYGTDHSNGVMWILKD
ncbi:SusD/RagB family nutrient-binding outer membrane lipoprotein [Chitinophaga nivalis]|uniref:SusD/RagB family nutrient-binding outer membrane lipoprotein n=1 Tax=Chitinophaga nivalis TaxID=2991709 RepID=A0ABT3IF50_9BACT|nr:SusD/RagB family nutrient-binding outer membrane lipoprotein [Chitinophaga nivalis]MCW3467724.1 SusD/RagB family nutrient-binding outer membrane lipoprotein [Chitinophaga nivalis]MCW3482584.1 SusD/RagB family nutrient-binding outer membrane lipoprotein [Chitinophaga nivalis]